MLFRGTKTSDKLGIERKKIRVVKLVSINLDHPVSFMGNSYKLFGL